VEYGSSPVRRKRVMMYQLNGSGGAGGRRPSPSQAGPTLRSDSQNSILKTNPFTKKTELQNNVRFLSDFGPNDSFQKVLDGERRLDFSEIKMNLTQCSASNIFGGSPMPGRIYKTDRLDLRRRGEPDLLGSSAGSDVLGFNQINIMMGNKDAVLKRNISQPSFSIKTAPQAKKVEMHRMNFRSTYEEIPDEPSTFRMHANTSPGSNLRNLLHFPDPLASREYSTLQRISTSKPLSSHTPHTLRTRHPPRVSLKYLKLGLNEYGFQDPPIPLENPTPLPLAPYQKSLSLNRKDQTFLTSTHPTHTPTPTNSTQKPQKHLPFPSNPINSSLLKSFVFDQGINESPRPRLN
jgi:hypothetical protein